MTGTRASLDLVADTMAAAIEDLAHGAAWTQESYASRLYAQTPQHPAETVQLTQSETCPWHDGEPAELGSLPWDVPFRDSLPLLYPARQVLLDWPVCTEAVCGTCGRASFPLQRVAAVRRGLPCPHCGAGALQPLAAVDRICAADALAARSPRQLGQPIRHLYRISTTADTLMCMQARSQ